MSGLLFFFVAVAVAVAVPVEASWQMHSSRWPHYLPPLILLPISFLISDHFSRTNVPDLKRDPTATLSSIPVLVLGSTYR